MSDQDTIRIEDDQKNAILQQPLIVVHLLKSNVFSGAESVVFRIMDIFRNSNIQMIYVCRRGPIEEKIKRNDFQYYLLDSFNPLEVAKCIKKIKPHIIHAHDYSAGTLAGLLAKEHVISHLHSNPTWASTINMKSISYRCASRYFDKILGVSDAVFNNYIFANDIKDRYFTLHNIIDENEVVIKSQREYRGEKYDLIYLGRLMNEKQPLEFIRIVNELINRKLNINAVMVGDGDLRTECEKAISDYGLDNHIHLLGYIENPYPILYHSSIVVIPSIFEGFPLVSLEAFVLGKPVVCSGVGGLREIVDLSNGYFAHTTEEYCNEIEKLLKVKDYYNAKAKSAILKAKEFTNIETYKKSLEIIYNDVVSM